MSHFFGHADCTKSKVQSTGYAHQSAVSLHTFAFHCPRPFLYGFDDYGKSNVAVCCYTLAFQHYQNEYDVPVVVELEAVLLGTLDVSSLGVRLRAKNIRYVYSVFIYSLYLDIVHFTLIRFIYLEHLLRLIE